MKKLVLVMAAILVIGYYIYFFVPAPSKKSPPPQSKISEEVHFHAGFLVYVDGKRVDLSDNKYMHIEPCEVEGIDKPTHTPREEQLEKAHLHNNIGNVAHVHVNGAKWGDLFTNINFRFEEGKEYAGFINGIENQDILNAPIKEYSSALFIIGNNQGIDKNAVVSKEEIEAAEAKSESC